MKKAYLVLALTAALAACGKADTNKATDTNKAAVKNTTPAETTVSTETANTAVATAEPAKDADPMVGCYTLAKGNYDIKITNEGGTYKADLTNSGKTQSAKLEELQGENLAGAIPEKERANVEKALASTVEPFFFIAKFKPGTNESDYMAVASIELGGGPAVKSACK